MVPNHVSRSLGDAWHTVEYLIALLSTKEDYKRSINQMPSWLSPIVCRILIPDMEDHEMHGLGIRLIDEFGGPPEWEESLEYIQMLQEALLDSKYCSASERNFRLSHEESDYLIISARPNADQNGKSGCAWNELRIFCDEKGRSDLPSSSSALPARKVYTCHVCRDPGDGFCWASNEGDATHSSCCVHPKCVLENSMAGPLKSLRGELEKPQIPLALLERFRSLYDSSKMDYDTKFARERQEFVVSIVDRHDANVFLDASHQTHQEELLKLTKIKNNMMRLGIIDEIIQILKVPLPQKFDRSEAKDYNTKMQRRMQIRRINFRFEMVSSTVDKILIAENLFQRMFHFLALAAKNSRQIQNLLQPEVPFFFSKALHTSSLASSGIFSCIHNVMNGRLDLASNIPLELLEQTLFSALEAQFPAKLLLLRPFLVQDGKNFPMNQLEVLEIILPANIANHGECFFLLDNDFPADLRNKASFENWRSRLVSSHPPARLHSGKDSAHCGEVPWKHHENWRHLLRISSDIAHGGCFAESQPCRSAFLLAVISILTDCALNNIDAVCGMLMCVVLLFRLIHLSAETKTCGSASILAHSSYFELRMQHFASQNVGSLFSTEDFSVISGRIRSFQILEHSKRSKADLFKL